MRIIAGSVGGREIKAVSQARPYLEKVRGAIFNALFDVSGARVLDLYAGSGALGIEALSRGAATAVFVESDPISAKIIAENVANLSLTAQSKIENCAVEVFLARAERNLLMASAAATSEKFSLVFIDPPFPAANHEACVKLLTAAEKLLTTAGRLIFRREWQKDLPPLTIANLTPRWHKIYGRSVVSFLVKCS